MLSKVKITRTWNDDGTLSTIEFKSRSLTQALENAAVVAEALGSEVVTDVKHKMTKGGKHKVTLS